MERRAQTKTIRELRSEFPRIEFPEYQREPSVWGREQKQRLLDSILREFDIAALYFYVRDTDGVWECIDGRQRLNAVMSFLGATDEVDPDRGFPLRIENEVAEDSDDPLKPLDGRTFAQLAQEQAGEHDYQEAVLGYAVTTVFLSGSRKADEFNLQFLRLNLGALINAGEKLHAMVGVMRDRIFDKGEGLGKHEFLAGVRIPTRRYAHELIAAQLMLQVTARASETRDFARARHFDLQRYLKEYAEHEDPNLGAVRDTLDALLEHVPKLSEKLPNRAIAVSVMLAAWEPDLRSNPELTAEYGQFVIEFLARLKYQADQLKKFEPDPRYPYLREFQRNLTQAAVERPAVRYRHEQLLKQFKQWRNTGQLEGDELPEPA